MSAPALPLDTRIATTEDHSGFAIVFDEVHLSFGENEVLRGVSFRLPFGETKALFGVAGSGKSVLLKLALGLLKSDSGRITVLGRDITQMRESKAACAKRCASWNWNRRSTCFLLSYQEACGVGSRSPGQRLQSPSYCSTTHRPAASIPSLPIPSS